MPAVPGSGVVAAGVAYLRKAMKVAEETLNKEHPFRLFTLDSVGALDRDLGRFAEAETLFQQS